VESSAWPAGFPKPPFDDPVQPVTGTTFEEWANNLYGTQGWPTQSEGTYDAGGQCVASVPEGDTFQAVIVGGPNQPVDCVSYVAVGGNLAGDVDVAVYPLVKGVQNYQGWNGSAWADGPAANSGGYYWYRMHVRWQPPYEDKILMMFAKSYRARYPLGTFTLWAFTAA
jgi:hypothetical protein